MDIDKAVWTILKLFEYGYVGIDPGLLATLIAVCHDGRILLHYAYDSQDRQQEGLVCIVH